MTYDAHTNLAYSLVVTAPSPASTGTSLSVTSGQGALFPAVPFNATIWPDGVQPVTTNAEIVRVTSIVGDTLTIVRGQEGTSARSVGVGDQIAATITVKTLTDVEDAIPASTADLPDSTDKRYVTDAELSVLGDTSGTNTGDQTSVTGNAGTATKLATARNIDGQSFDGSADVTVIAPGTHAATAKATPVDGDEVPLVDSAASNVLKKLTWANLKATLKTYTDTLYPSGSGTSSGTNTGDQTSVTGNAGTASALATARNIDGQAFDGTANITVIAPGTHAASSKATPVDADELSLVDSAASNVLKKLTWANLKAAVKAYADTLYPSGSGTSSGTNTGDQTITLTGDVTGTGTGSFAASIGTGKVTSAMIADGTIVDADVSSSAALAVSKLADPTTGKVIGSASSAAAAVFPPGYEIGYTEITSSVNITGSTSAGATTVISPGALTFDGAPVLVTVFSPQIVCDTAAIGDLFRVRIFEGSTEIGMLGQIRSDVTGTTNIVPFHGTYRFTPSAGSHTYIIKCTATTTTGTPSFGGGAGGTDTILPAFCRFTKI